MDLPNAWERIRLGDLIELEYGKSLVKKERKANGSFPVYGSSGIVGRHDQFYVENPTIVIGRKGNVGAVWLVKECCWPIDTTYFVKASKNLSTEFLFFLLKELQLGQYDKSTAIPGLNRNDAYNLWVSLPPIAEQHRIVDKIEELFSDLDDGIKSLKTAQQQLKVYRQAVLKWAFEGKLTAEWREEQRRLGKLESADVLLEKIKEERSQQYQKSLEIWKRKIKSWEIDGKVAQRPKKPREPKDLKVSQDDLIELIDLPREWNWVFPENIVSPEKYALGIGPFGSNLKVSDYQETGRSLIFVRHITNNDFDLKPKFISEDKFITLLPHATKPKDLLITKMGDPPGDCELYPAGRQEAIITADCLKFRIWAKYVSRKFYKYCINSTIIKKQLGLITQGVAQKKISLERFKGLRFPFPSLNEQNVIVEEIESRLSICDRLQADITTNLEKAEALRQSILKQAFEGKLVPQNPNDEPATILLERIRTEKSFKGKCKLEQKNLKKKNKLRKCKQLQVDY